MKRSGSGVLVRFALPSPLGQADKMRNPLRVGLDALDALAAAKIADEGWAFHTPTICEQWLDDRRRVLWLQERLGKSGLSYSIAKHDQQTVETFCNVIEEWGDELIRQDVPDPQAIMTDSDIASSRRRCSGTRGIGTRDHRRTPRPPKAPNLTRAVRRHIGCGPNRRKRSDCACRALCRSRPPSDCEPSRRT